MADRRAELQKKAENAAAEYEQEVARVKSECAHALDNLVLTEGVTTGYFRGSAVEHEITVTCMLCNSQFTRYVRFNKD
jgi:hypothetical protein